MQRKNLVFALVSTAIFIDMLMYSLIIPILPTYALSLGADEFTIGVIFGAFSVALLLFSVPFGIVSDRVGRVPLLIAGMFLLAAATGVFAVSDNLYVLVLARIVQGISGAATWSAGLALIADTFDASERGARLGLAMAIMSAGMLIGPVTGGFIYDHFGYAWAFALPSAMALLTGLLFLAIRPATAPGVSSSNYVSLLAKAPLAFVACSVAIVAGALIFGVLEPFMPVYLYEKFSATPTVIGLAFGVMSLVNIAAAPLVGKLYDRHGGRVLLAPGLAVSGILVAVAIAMPSLPLTVGLLALLGFTVSFGLTPMLPLLSDLFGGADNNAQGLIYGVYNTLFSLGLCIGPFVGGALIVRAGFSTVVYALALLLLLTGTFLFLTIHDRTAPTRETR